MISKTTKQLFKPKKRDSAKYMWSPVFCSCILYTQMFGSWGWL